MPGKKRDRAWTKGESSRSVIDKNVILSVAGEDADKVVYEPNNGPCYKFEVTSKTYNINLLVDPETDQWDSGDAEPLDGDEEEVVEVDRERGKPVFKLGLENLASTACTVHVRSYKWFDEV